MEPLFHYYFKKLFSGGVMCLAASMPFMNLASFYTLLSSKWLKHFYTLTPLTLTRMSYRIKFLNCLAGSSFGLLTLSFNSLFTLVFFRQSGSRQLSCLCIRGVATVATPLLSSESAYVHVLASCLRRSSNYSLLNTSRLMISCAMFNTGSPLAIDCNEHDRLRCCYC